MMMRGTEVDVKKCAAESDRLMMVASLMHSHSSYLSPSSVQPKCGAQKKRVVSDHLLQQSQKNWMPRGV